MRVHVKVIVCQMIVKGQQIPDSVENLPCWYFRACHYSEHSITASGDGGD